MELAGRESEIATLDRAVADIRRGRSRVVGVFGEAGIGKTALLGTLRARADAAGLLVLEGRGAEHERDVPFGVAIDTFDDHVATLHPRRVETLGPDLGAVLPSAAGHRSALPESGGATERFRCHRAIRSLVELLARERPLVLALDDLHWADDASIELVLHLLRRPPRAPHLLAFALRPSGHAARLLDAARTADGFAHLAPAPLDRDAALGLLDGLGDAGLRERIADEARGNPLFLHELARVARAPDGPLPPTLVAAVQLELSLLAPDSQLLLAGGAVAGDRFDPDLAGAAAGLDPEATAAGFDELVAADLVRPTGHGPAFAFRHPLVQRAVYVAAAPAWRLDAHARVAGALGARRAALALRAYHVEKYARPGEEPAIALLTAAAATAADTAPATAARWYGAAARLLPDDAARRAAVLAPMAFALAGAGRLAESRGVFAETLDLLPPGRTPDRVRLVLACAEVETLMGRYADARERLLRALADLDGDDGRPAPGRAGGDEGRPADARERQSGAPADPRGDEGRAELALQLAISALWGADLPGLREWAGHATRAAAAIGDAALLASAEAIAAVGADWSVDAARAAASVDRAAARLDALGDAQLAARVGPAVHVASVQLLTERYAGAGATATRALALAGYAGATATGALGRAGRTEQAQVLAPLLVVRARALTELLDLDAALRDVEAAEETARLQGIARFLHLALWRRAVLHHHRGEAGEARRVAAECVALGAELEPTEVVFTAGWQLAAMSAEEDPARVLAELRPLADRLFEPPHPTWPSALGLVLVRTAIATGQLDDAARWARRAQAQAETLGLPASAVRASCARAEVLLAHGRAAEAARLADAAAVDAGRAAALLDAADARLLAARAVAAQGDVEEATARLQRLAAGAGRGGALRLRDAAARELRRLGVRVSAEARRAAGTAGADGLTERERHVAQLVVRGLTNKQVGAELFLSEKTIEHTLTKVYGKLEVRSRVELTRRLALT